MRKAALPAARTRTESLRLWLEGEILEQRFSPGEKLDEAGIASRFGMSRTPVREALRAMMSTGLVQVRPHQGTFVASLTPEAIIEMVETMMVLEVACAGLAARRLTSMDRTAITRAQEACADATERDDPMAFYAANTVFHDAIYHASHNGFLAEQAQALRQRLEPYRRRITYHPGSMKKALEEHGRIVAALTALDAVDSELAMREHLGALQDSIATMIRATPPKRLAGLGCLGAGQPRRAATGR